jgi:cytochrome c556
MGKHFSRATQAQTAVINADLETAREHAAWLRDHPGAEAFPENASDEMRLAAASLATAENILLAAQAVGRLGSACGHCHTLMGAKTGLDSNTTFPPGTTLPERMSRHQWAADRMWEGLIAPSDQLWALGAEALMEAPLSSDQVARSNDPAIDLIGQQIRDLAEQASTELDHKQRAKLYGGFLARCSACHAGFRK